MFAPTRKTQLPAGIQAAFDAIKFPAPKTNHRTECSHAPQTQLILERVLPIRANLKPGNSTLAKFTTSSPNPGVASPARHRLKRTFRN